ncbi:MAG TPA: PhzF family phenazine biosynthesis protein [Pseudolabrys sp.]|nr:PhzF family phenazine biosynthesis protein [Pseudolabrys sp.]
MKRRFATLDVFTQQRFAGNPLAVVLDCVGLETAAMQALAAEFNLSETVFVLPPQQPSHRATLRIFTPTRELPFAGHPTVGTAVLLGLMDGGEQARTMLLAETVGPVSCRVASKADAGEATFDLPKLPVEAGPPPLAATLAEALGITEDDIEVDGWPPSCWSAGNGFTFVPLKSRAAVASARPNRTVFNEKLTGPSHGAVFVFARETAEAGHDFHARMFAPAMGFPEDPATGSAAAAFAGVLSRFGGLLDGTHDVMIEQGYEMGRPSLIRLGLTLQSGTLTAASIGGPAVMVCEGTIEA